jgi:hypothetical protein
MRWAGSSAAAECEKQSRLGPGGADPVVCLRCGGMVQDLACGSGQLPPVAVPADRGTTGFRQRRRGRQTSASLGGLRQRRPCRASRSELRAASNVGAAIRVRVGLPC